VTVRISVITPSLNQGKFIQRTLDSVLSQNIDGLELLVFDGESVDDTVDILHTFSARCQWISEPDRGQAHAINKGFSIARGEIIGWLNSDDVYRPGALQHVLEFFDYHPEVGLLYGNADFIDEHDSVIEPYYTEPWDPERLLDICFICQPSAFFRRSVLDRCGLLNEQLHFCMDYEYWLRMASAGVQVAYTPESLAASRLYATTKTLGSRLKFHAEINEMLRSRVGYVPDRWLTNEAHTRLDLANMTYGHEPVRFAVSVSVLSWWLSLKWNHGISRSLLRKTSGWMAGAFEQRMPQASVRALRWVRSWRPARAAIWRA
jgi:glycosyltransferase involved in cell wall biosynthesis